MLYRQCSDSKKHIAAQTLFLGASVADFNMDMGWGGNRSQLTVKLVEDSSPFFCGNSSQFVLDRADIARQNYDIPNHYYDCTTDETCFIDENGNPYGPNRNPRGKIPPSKERVVPGKLFYSWTNRGLVSKYWRDQDPGFFGNATSIDHQGIYRPGQKNNAFDIIDVPVVFRMGSTAFVGLVKSWEKNYDSGGLNYNLSIESIDSILEQSWVILDKYSGSIFSKFANSPLGAPSLYSDSFNPALYTGRISEGTLHNVFNVYGFLESFGVNNYGGSLKNDRGISATAIIDALSVLTSSRPLNPEDPASGLLQKRAFSPFGRILLKVPQTKQTYLRITEGFNGYGMGFLPVSRDINGIQRCHVSLDLTELPRLPFDYRISEPVMNINQLIQQITTDTGCDFYYDVIPIVFDKKVEVIIKLKTIFRSSQPDPNQIERTIESFQNNGVPIASSKVGKEKNVNVSRAMYIGANQQRLFQAKSYRLAFTQTNYIYNAVTKQFVEFLNSPAGILNGKVKEPNILSTRNPILSTNEYGVVTDINQQISEQLLGSNKFENRDSDWSDVFSGISKTGNYQTTKVLKRASAGNGRFFPLYQDVICPFLGYKHDENIAAGSSSSDPNIIRSVRPVWMDNWTGQIILLIEASELPATLHAPLYSPYAGSNYFMVSESEIRAAMAGFDSFMTYCVGKIFKPDLYASLYNSYLAAGKFNTGLAGQIYPASPSVPIPAAQSIPKPPPAPATTPAANPPPGNTVAASIDPVFESQSTTVTGTGDIGNSLLSGGNVANSAGHIGPVVPTGPFPLFSIDTLSNLQFLKDLQTLCRFIGDIGNNYYGKKYMVRVPEVYSYQDREYLDLQLPQSSSSFSVYQGSGKIFYNYTPTNEGAWEEFGNFIDDTILVGSPYYYALSDDSGKIKPILGYNASDSFDYFTSYLCKNPIIRQALNFSSLSGGGIGIDATAAEAASLAGKCDQLFYPAINVSALNPGDFIITPSPIIHPDQHNTYRNLISRRLYHAANLEENFIFLDPVNLRNPRAIIEVSSSVNLNSNASNYGSDPNLTVLSNASLEDLCLYLRATALISPIILDPDFVNILLSRNASVQTNGGIAVPSVFGTNASYHQLAPKAAHPYFAAIPLKSNQFTYGPWTNYPVLDRNSVYPDAYSDEHAINAIDNLIGGVKIEHDEDLAPWNYGGMRFLDQAVLSRVYNEVQYQQIIETASLSIPGLPIFGLASDFVYFNSNPRLSKDQFVHNNKIYRLSSRAYSYAERSVVPNILSTLPLVGNPTGNPIADYAGSDSIISNPVNYFTLSVNDTNISSVAPIITNISCSISPQSVQTNYSFRTYIQKIGFFNKEVNDRIKKNALINIKKNKQLSDISRAFNNKVLTEIQKVKSEKANTGVLDNLNSGFFGTSPTELLIGGNFPWIRSPIDFSALIDLIRSGSVNDSQALQRFNLNIGADPGEGQALQDKFNTDPYNTLLDLKTNKTYVGNYMPREALAELRNEYSNKAVMSLDGIFSPVSFYPTIKNTTFSLRKYFTKHCPLCKGTGKLINFSQRYKTRQPPQQENFEIKCPSCSVKKQELTDTVTSASSSGEVLPPYIITNENDFNTILQFNLSGGSSSVSQADPTKTVGIKIPINQISLQPITVPYGEFKNFNSQKDDRSRHCIRILGKGEVPPMSPLYMSNHENQNNYLDTNGKLLPKGQAVGTGHNPDYYGMDIIAKNHRLNTDKFSYLMNQRFFGFRGPMVMHGWGYDMEGYPVPNESDEPKIVDHLGRPARFVIKIEKLGEFNYSQLNSGDTFCLKKDEDSINDPNQLIYYNKRNNLQVFDTDNADWVDPKDDDKVIKLKISNDLDKTPNYKLQDGVVTPGDQPHYLNVGDIITKQYNYSGSKWVKGQRSDKFYKNWSERPDIWPVGPVDLRWDESRGVWTIKSSTSPYKMVYITLEEDLVTEEDFSETYPARGFLDEIEYSKDPLPNGFRRIVYVRDKTGFTAPKGIKLLCRYDTDSGYYEPISKPSVVTDGTIGTGNTANINMYYVQGNRAGIVPILTINFDNPLKFEINGNNQKGIFTFINGKWNLTAIN